VAELVRAGRVRELRGIGPSTEARLLQALAREDDPRPQRGILLSRPWELVGGIAAALGGEPAGDVRRWRDSCELLAVVCAAPDPASALARFAALPQIVAVVEQGERRAVGVTVEGVSVELVTAEPERFGTALVRATGSAAYVAALEPLPDATDEAAVYHALGLPWCPPELREAPFRGEPPGEEIAAANERLAPFRVLRGIECDILPDGRLDLPDDVLAELDWVQASVHGGQRMPRRELTKRVEEALRNPSVRCLSHPKGRLINRRPENALDLERVFEVAREEGVALEVKGLPDRLDLRGEHVRDALRAGVQIVCSTDAHSPRALEYMTLAVRTARRGWATRADVVNTRPLVGTAPRARTVKCM
jgi:histidinol phosphatase-like PHP family hydrolase